MSASLKPAKGTAKRERAARKRARKDTETAQMRAARERDGYCRFPYCGCVLNPRPLEVAHLQHRGMGGNPAGDRTTTDKLILLCRDRHQNSVFCMHRNTITCEPLTDAGADGPVRWLVSLEAVGKRQALHGLNVPLVDIEQGGWIEVAREDRPGHLAPDVHNVAGWQILFHLREMSC